MVRSSRPARHLGRLFLFALVAAPMGAASGVALVHLGVSAGDIGLAGSAAYGVDHRALAVAEAPGPGLRALFIGNSFTSTNDLPELVRRLALTAAPTRPLLAVQWTPPGELLQADVGNRSLARAMRAVRWNAVVLQEQSQQLSYPASWWVAHTFPAAQALQRASAGSGTRTLLFETWGYRDGNFAGDSFSGMQERLMEGSSQLAFDLDARVVPAGEAFATTLSEEPDADLWQADGRHPSLEGSYLAACVMFGELYGVSPVRSTFDGGLVPAQARVLRQIAAEIVARDQ